MQSITIVTGNRGKLAEWQRIFPASYKLESKALDLVEIQSFNSIEVAKDKAERAFEAIGKPVVVDDISAGLDDLQGLPGPFIKYFEDRLGKGALFRLSGNKDAPCTLTAIAAYYDGNNSVVGVGKLHGTVVSPRGKNGFGFDFVFMPDGYTQTFSEMTAEEKDKMSHRTLAIKDLVKQLNELYKD